jgi:hypothetical protein
MLRMLERPGRLVGNRGNLAIHVEQFAFAETEAFDDVLERVRMDYLFERLAQEIMPAFWISQVAINRPHDDVGDERLGGGEEAEVALDHATPSNAAAVHLTTRYPLRVREQKAVYTRRRFWRARSLSGLTAPSLQVATRRETLIPDRC